MLSLEAQRRTREKIYGCSKKVGLVRGSSAERILSFLKEKYSFCDALCLFLTRLFEHL